MKMKIQLIVFISIFSLQLGFAQSVVSPSPPEKIKILSWNIYMLPSIVKAQGKKERAMSIGKLLKESDYDVIVFQEAFQRKARKKIFNQLKESFPYQAGPANQKLISYRTNSGLWIFSKHPIVNTQSIVFRNRSGVDALSRKGGLIAEILVNEVPIQVAATHLQNAEPAWIRQSQCVEFYNRLLKPFYKEGIPQIICGDFNINRERKEEYDFMLNTLHATDGELAGEVKFTYDRANNDLKVEPGNRKDLIDYILVHDEGGQLLTTSRQIKILKDNWNQEHADLSDHYALEAEVRFNHPIFISSKQTVGQLLK
jgi:endonuclease/exonuclease/phosphatase family metal-dependent hydrolase